jgi:DNA repair photolyase
MEGKIMFFKVTDPIAIKFSTDEELEKAAEELIEYTFQFISDGAFKISREDAKRLKEKGLKFEEYPIVPIYKLPPEERRRLREKYWFGVLPYPLKR